MEELQKELQVWFDRSSCTVCQGWHKPGKS
jgi:hypothetical protein